MTMHLAARVGLISALALCLTSGDPAYRAIVRIRPHAPNGDLVTDFVVTVNPLYRDSSTPIVVHYKGTPIEKGDFSIETGQYLLTIDAPGFQRSRETISVYQPSVLRTALLRLAYEFDEYSVSGRVKGYPANPGKIRVRLISLYGNVLRESTVDHDGSFYFPAQQGPFLLSVLADEADRPIVLENRAVFIKGKEVVTIHITGHPAK